MAGYKKRSIPQKASFVSIQITIDTYKKSIYILNLRFNKMGNQDIKRPPSNTKKEIISNTEKIKFFSPVSFLSTKIAPTIQL